jgi:nucleoside-diphosphate-sugar epimerase
MRLLITGHQGFIGGHLLKRYPKEAGIDKKSGRSTSEYSLLDGLVQLRKPDLIVHLGANCSTQISLRDPQLDFTDNVVGTFNVCEVARKRNIPIIFNSSMKVYPGEDGIITPYGLSKLVGEQYIKMYHELYNLEYIINRPSSVYGPNQDGSEDGGWFTWFIKAYVQNKTVTLFGDGTQTRDVLYIDDHVDLLVDQIENFDLYKNNEYDFGGGPENVLSLNTLLETLDYDRIIEDKKLPGDVQHFANDNIAVGKINGWSPKVGWQEGLERTKEWLIQSL